MSLYKKVRPQEFDDMRGNEAAVELAKSLLQNPDHPHAFGIFGPSGCGKTTLARIIAKQLGADDLSINEINSSNTRGIDAAREITELMRFRSATGAPTVFIIDECHKATNDWQNAMLKPLEDYPSHVYFFLCTTEPDKLIKAIHTRLTRLDVSVLKEDEMRKLVKSTAKKEKIKLSDDVLDKIVICAQGSARQALVLLETISVIADEELQLQAIREDADEQAETIDLCRAFLASRSAWTDIAKVLTSLKDTSDPEKVRRAVLGYMQAVLLKKDNRAAAIVMQEFAQNTYDSGFAQITTASYQAWAAIND